MTNKPTDHEIAALAVEINKTDWNDAMDALICFAREVLARWGQPAHSGEPVAFIHWPINGPPRLAWYSQKALNDAILKTYEGHQPDVELFTAPQPVERKPLTDLEIESATGAKIGTPLFLVAKGFVLATESAHGTKGGQHG